MNDISETRKLEEAHEWREGPWSIREASAKARDFLGRMLKEHPEITVPVIIVVLLSIYIERPLFQSLLMFVRIYAGGVLIAALAAFGIWRVLRSRSVRLKTFGGAFVVLTCALVLFFGREVHEYLAQYLRYQSLRPAIEEIADFQHLPRTDKERILPLRGVYTMARERMNETESPTVPDLVRAGDEYHWTMAVQPERLIGRAFYPVGEIMSIPSAIPSPDFSRRHPTKVHFTVGENLYFSRNTETCARRAFGPWRSFNYEPAEVFYMQDDSGKWVQAVSLIKWAGLLFPWPEFGGVQVIEEGSTNWFGRVFLGCGTWVPPEEISRHAFLVGQNLVPYEVTRFMATSLRFQAGFFGPLRFSRVGDMRIADVPEDVNQQPFTLFFRKAGEKDGKLYQYFAMEPKDEDKQGLSTSFWFPADGIGRPLAYRHFQHHEAPLGVTAVADKVRASKKLYDWTHNAVVEVRPYIHDIADSNGKVEVRFEWMTTVVAIKSRKEGESPEYTSGSDPEIAITDANRGRVVWVNHDRPEKWPDELHESLGPLWATDSR